jgi:endonuclease YncB( thermonuclease family)
MLFKRCQSLNFFHYVVLLTVIISGCSSVNSENLSLSNKSDYAQLKEGSVWDGDSFRVIKNGEEIKIRMACIDAPEKKQELGIASRDYLRSLLNKNPNKLIVVKRGIDRFGRTIAEVFIPTGNGDEEIPVNGVMIRSGMAHFYSQFARNCSDNADQYAQLEKEAQRSRVGIWKNPNVMLPSEFRRKNR